MSEIAQQYGQMPQDEADWLSELAADWQIIADLSFADLVMWRKVEDGFVAIAHCRPSTGPTVHQEEVVGIRAQAGRIAEQNRRRCPVSSSTRLSLTRGARTDTAPAAVATSRSAW